MKKVLFLAFLAALVLGGGSPGQSLMVFDDQTRLWGCAMLSRGTLLDQVPFCTPRKHATQPVPGRV